MRLGRLLFPAAVLVGIGLFGCTPEPPVIPRPAEVRTTGELVPFGPRIGLEAPDGLGDSLRVYGEHLTADGFTLVPGAPARVRLVPSAEVSPEGYRLNVGSRPGGTVVTVEASDPAGFFYALGTLDQLVRTEQTPGFLPQSAVDDAPRYPWRGCMVDSARHFIPIEYLKKHLVRMAELKMNVFHWHLTDDQGWRFEVPGYPRLTSVGAWRSLSSAIGMEPEAVYNDKHQYGGFYSDADISSLVALAGSLHIRIVPEVEMPGHMGAALAAYPELGGTGPGVIHIDEPPALWGVFNLALNPGQDQTYRFVEAVVQRLTVLFPGEYIHIGGDEVRADGSWAAAPACQMVMAQEKFHSPAQLVGYFHRRVTEILAAHHRIPVGWEEVLDGYLDQDIRPPTVLQFWKNENYLRLGLARGHRFIFSPADRMYFDMFYKKPEPKLWAGYISLDRAYGLDPASLTSDDRQVLGVEAELWSEYTYTDQILDNRLWPRLLAAAEVGWTPRNRKDWGDFSQRVAVYSRHMTNLGIHFNRCEGVPWPQP